MSGITSGSGGRITQKITGVTTITTGTATASTTIAAVVLLLSQLRFLGVQSVTGEKNMAKLILTNTTTVTAAMSNNAGADMPVGWELTEYSQ